MRDRLVELLCNVKCEGEECFGNCPHRIGQKCNKVQRLEMCSVFAIADHLLAAGVIVPPCKVGDTVYSIKATYSSKCHLGTYWDEIRCNGCECTCDSHSTYSIQEETVIELSCGGRYWRVKTNKTNGNFVFLSDTPYGRYLTREEAEEALKGSNDGKAEFL